MKPTKVLIVDDEPFIRDLIFETLARQRFVVSSAASGLEALESVASDPPDVVLLDVRLGGDLDGLDVCRKICAQKKPPAVVFLTGLANNADMEAGLALGARGYLTKPFSPLELIECIQKACEAKA